MQVVINELDLECAPEQNKECTPEQNSSQRQPCCPLFHLIGISLFSAPCDTVFSCFYCNLHMGGGRPHPHERRSNKHESGVGRLFVSLHHRTAYICPPPLTHGSSKKWRRRGSRNMRTLAGGLYSPSGVTLEKRDNMLSLSAHSKRHQHRIDVGEAR
jgi:hypothetical protein